MSIDLIYHYFNHMSSFILFTQSTYHNYYVSQKPLFYKPVTIENAFKLLIINRHYQQINMLGRFAESQGFSGIR